MILTRLIRICLALVLAVTAGVVTLAVAQDAKEQEERSALTQFVERIISTPDRQIRLGAIQGALSSNVSFSEITIADREGVWLRIENVHLVWSRRALLGGRLEIDSLEADSITMERRPSPPEDEIPEEAQLRVPELPVATNIEHLAVPRVVFGEDVFGLGSALSVEGRLRLAGGDLDTALEIERLDGPGGQLRVATDYDSSAEHLDLDIALSEPEDGVVANLLNLRGRPALDFAIAGSGPVGEFEADINLLADGRQLLAGTSRITRVTSGFRFLADVDGRLGELAPPQYTDLFGERFSLSVDATRHDDGAVTVRRSDLLSGVMALSATAELAPDYFPVSFALDARLGTDTEDLVTLPFADGITVRSGRIHAEVGGTDPDGWTARFELDELDAGTVAAERALITAGGVARNREVPEERELTFEVSGAAERLSSDDEALAEALGSSLELAASGAWSHGMPVEITEARLAADPIAAEFAGRIADSVIDGVFRVSSPDIAHFSGLAGREIGGSVDFAATGTMGVSGDRFDLDLEGTAQDIEAGFAAPQGFFEGETRLTGAVARNEEGALRFDALELAHEDAQVTLSGAYDREEVDLSVAGTLADISAFTDRASGAARLDLTVTGTPDTPAVEAVLSGDNLLLMDRPFRGAQATFTGLMEGSDVAGNLALSGRLDGVAVNGETRIVGRKGIYAFEDIALSAADTSATGNLTLLPGGLFDGALAFDSPDLSVIAPLILSEMSGSASANLGLAVADGEQNADLQAVIRNVRFENAAVASADVDVRGENLLVAPQLAGSIEAAGIRAGPIEIDTLSATAEQVDGRTEFSARAELDEGTVITTGRLVPDNGGLDIEFDTFELEEAAINGRLAEPATITVRQGTVSIPSARLAVDGGSAVVSGRIGETLNLQAEIDALDLAVANAFAPELGLAGTVSGTVTATGPASEPRGRFSLRGAGLSAARLREAGIASLSFTIEAEMADGEIRLDAAVNGGGMAIETTGTVPLTGRGLRLVVTGAVPLSLADEMLAEQAASLAGTLSVNAEVRGSLADLDFAGTLAADDATFVHAGTGFQLSDITLRIALTRNRAEIETLTGRSAAGGTISVTGTVGLARDSGLPADLSATLSDFRHQDGRLITAVADGELSLTGPLADQPVLEGTIFVQRAEVTVPERMPAGVAMLDVTHRNAPQPVLDTARRARVEETRSREGPDGLRLDLTIDAPARVFVRGRGIDAEFGGTITLTGPASNIRPIGSFDLRRGHISLLGQRVNFNSGTITLIGDLDPVLDFVATTRARHIAVTATVTGPASDPEIVLSSVPELPQDEVLAQFLFGRSLDDLSPFQIAQLANAAAGIVGGTGEVDLLGELRGAIGLDELDLVAGEEGGAAVQAGRYVTENVYLGVRAGTNEEDTGATVNLDLTDDVTARGEVGADGRSKLGVYFEREY